MKPLYEYRIRRVRRSCAADVTRISTPETAAELFRTFCGGESRELFMAASLDAQNACLGIEVVALGGAMGVEVHPREVFRAAIMVGAVGIIVAHNHPSCDPRPSPQDIELTARLKQCGDLLGIPLFDHIIVTDTGRYHSFGESGRL